MLIYIRFGGGNGIVLCSGHTPVLSKSSTCGQTFVDFMDIRFVEATMM